jgi:hypothetical protein
LRYNIGRARAARRRRFRHSLPAGLPALKEILQANPPLKKTKAILSIEVAAQSSRLGHRLGEGLDVLESLARELGVVPRLLADRAAAAFYSYNQITRVLE